MVQTHTAGAPDDLIHTMHTQHLRIDALLHDMEALVTGDDRDAMRACWAKLEDEILAHLNFEELHLVPAIADRDPGHARMVRSEHDKIRARMGEIGLALDLELARAEQVEGLAAMLRIHAHLEETGLYPLAEAEMPATRKAS